MRDYEASHGWITFRVDLAKSPPSLWMNLGEAKSKCEHIANEPLRPSTAKVLHQLYFAKGVAATTAIEGNSLTEEQVRQHLDGKLKLPPSKAYLQQEIDNIIIACNKIRDNLVGGSGASIGIETIKQFDRTVLEKLTLEPGVTAGEIRTHSVVVGGIYRGAPAKDCEYLLIKLCEWLESDDFRAANESQQIVYAILKAVIAHVYLAWIHPFGDGNGRTARLIEFQILLAAGVPTPAAHLLSNHYNLTRQQYYRELDKASKSGGDLLPFICYAVQGFTDGLREQLQYIKTQQWDIVWQNFIHNTFRDKDTPRFVRQKALALQLGHSDEFVPVAKLSELTPKLAKLYAGKTIRTVQRDVLELEVEHDLIERKEHAIRAKRELILGFLPLIIKPKNKDQMLLL